MICPKCRAVVEDDSRFCRSCGGAVGAATVPAPAPAKAPMAAPAPASPASAAPAPQTLDASRDPAQEQQVWQGRTAWRSYYGIWTLWGILSFAALLGVYKATPNATVRDAVWLLALAAAIVLFIRQSSTILSVRYRLTTQRLFIHRGILSRVTDQTELVRVDDVRLRQGVFDRLLNTGDVEIIGSDKTDQETILHSIDAPAEVAEQIRRYVRTARGKGSLFVENV